MFQKLNETPIAIIGMASVFPEARNLREFWDNIVREVDCIVDVPESRWKVADYYDPDPSVPDKTYSKRGGFLPEIDFDPMEFGLPPNILEVTDVSQLMSLVVARDALNDSGYSGATAEVRDRTGVVLGVGGGQKLITPLTARLQDPIWQEVLKSYNLGDEDVEKIIEKMKLAYVKWEENSFPGMLGNVIAGRIANRLDLGGMNCVVDAACASSLAAMKLAISDLVEGRADMMITGGVDTDNSIFMYMCFSKTPAFTPGDHPRPFDEQSDGMMIGEGIGMIVLKRLEDAKRDGDRIYAVIRGLGSSSDGRFKSIYAPRGEGQEKALDRAYEDAGIAPTGVQLLEAHGTGTVAGDLAETTTLVRFFNKHVPTEKQNGANIALGSIKSQIGHAKAAAGIAGIMKAALAIHHKVLPATLNVDAPNPKLGLDDSPLYVNTQTRPWIANGVPRRAGVSSFGFGGTNFHVVMEEFTGDHDGTYRLHKSAAAIVLNESTPASLAARVNEVLAGLQGEDAETYFYNLVQEAQKTPIPVEHARIGFAAESPEQAATLLQAVGKLLETKADAEEWSHPKGVFYRRNSLKLDGKVVALFSGQGSQYANMGRQLTLNFPEMRQSFACVDRLFAAEGLKPVSEAVYPPPAFTDEDKAEQADMIRRTDYVQPAIGAFSTGLFKLLQKAGFAPDFVGGHSFGELTALWAGGVINDDDYYKLVKARGAAMAPPPDPNFNAGTMMAVTGDVSNLQDEIAGFAGVSMANINSPKQVVLAGKAEDLAPAQEALTAKGYNVVQLPVSAAFHTPLVGHAQRPFAHAIGQADFKKPTIPVYSNASGKPYPQDPAAIQKTLEDHILNAVNFREEIENLHAAGGYLFVEFGPRSVLTNLVSDILQDKPHVAVAFNASRKKGSDHQFHEALARLKVLGLQLYALDTYAANPVAPEAAGRRKGMKVKISAAPYVSDKTRKTYQDALNNGDTLSMSGEVREIVKEVPVIKEVIKEVPGTKPAPVVSSGASLDQALALFSEQQREILRAHQRYLDNQAEYIKVFTQLTAQQQATMSNGGISAEAVKSLTDSMDSFHSHQAETLRVHETYLLRQSEQTNALLQVIRGGSPAAVPTMPVQSDSTPVAQSVVATTPAPVEPEPVVEATTVAPAQATPVAPAPSSTPAPVSDGLNVEALSAALLDIVSEKTGYPTEMLDLDMDIEADLGIDSIKRVEILGAMRDQFPDLPQFEATDLAELRTLAQIVDYMKAHSSNGASPPPATISATATIEESPEVAPVTSETPTSAPSDDLNVEALSAALLDIVSEKTGYPAEMLDLDMDIEADLGIDSIKRVEILGAMRDQFPDLPQFEATDLAELRTLAHIVDYMKTHSSNGASPPPVQETVEEPPKAAPATSTPTPEPDPGGLNVEALSSALLDIVSEKTGYPTEMLDLDMDIEADLGIDSIKRVEILGAMRDQFPDLPQFEATDLAELRTLAQIVDYMKTNAEAGVPAVEGMFPKADASVANGHAARPALTPLQHDIPRSIVSLQYLPEPDRADITWPVGRVCLLTDDGTAFTTQVAQQLTAHEWKVIVLSFPTDVVPAQVTPSPDVDRVDRVALNDLAETTLQEALQSISAQHGDIAALVHLNPRSESSSNGYFIEREKTLVKQVFLLAKHLKSSLNTVAEQDYAAFVTVVRLDGALGTEGDSPGVIAGGLFGLVKSVNLEWPKVFCRGIDLAGTLPDDIAADHIVAELHDPNRLLVEVAYNHNSRQTLVATETTR